MILVDANLLIYAHVDSFPQHSKSRLWLDGHLNGTAPVGLPWPSLLAFVRLVTNPRIFERAESIEEAWQQVDEWLDCSPVWTPQPTVQHREVMRKLLINQGIRSNLIPDAHLAALAVEHGLILYSTDGDFGRFAGLRWENPLT